MKRSANEKFDPREMMEGTTMDNDLSNEVLSGEEESLSVRINS